jgi:hypothetical protein
MLRSWTFRLLMIAAVACGAAACDDETPTTPITPRDPVTESFMGSITPNGARTHSFETGGSGAVVATLREVVPDGDLTIGFSLGNWNGTACQIVQAKDDAKGGTVLTGTMSGVGSLCVRVYDVGTLTADPVAYTVEVVHP